MFCNRMITQWHCVVSPWPLCSSSNDSTVSAVAQISTSDFNLNLISFLSFLFFSFIRLSGIKTIRHLEALHKLIQCPSASFPAPYHCWNSWNLLTCNITVLEWNHQDVKCVPFLKSDAKFCKLAHVLWAFLLPTETLLAPGFLWSFQFCC